MHLDKNINKVASYSKEKGPKSMSEIDQFNM